MRTRCGTMKAHAQLRGVRPILGVLAPNRSLFYQNPNTRGPRMSSVRVCACLRVCARQVSAAAYAARGAHAQAGLNGAGRGKRGVPAVAVPCGAAAAACPAVLEQAGRQAASTALGRGVPAYPRVRGDCAHRRTPIHSLLNSRFASVCWSIAGPCSLPVTCVCMCVWPGAGAARKGAGLVRRGAATNARERPAGLRRRPLSGGDPVRLAHLIQQI